VVTEYPNEPWSNWAGNITLTPFRHCHPRSRQDLVEIVQQAETLGRRVRAGGSHWSFTDIAITEDFIVETDQLNNMLQDVIGTALNAQGTALQLVHIEAGIKVADLCSLLDSMNLALSTMGGSDGQSLAGILCTSVHGPDFDRGPVPDMVRAVHLVGPCGAEHWIEPAAGITDPVALQGVLGIPAENIHYSDDWFDAAITSVGTLGIVYSAIIEVESQYDLVQTIATHTWPEVRDQLVSGAVFQPPNRAVQVAIDTVEPHTCFLYTRTQAPATVSAPYSVWQDPLGLFCTTALADALVEIPAGAGIFLAAAAPFIPLLPPPLDVIYGTLLAAGAVTAIEVAPLVGAIWALGPGALGDVVATALNGNPGLTAQAIIYLTKANIPVGTTRGFAHTVMAGPDPGACAARGLALEIAFDATTGSHINFVDAALPLLDQWFTTEGLALGGWFSLRFVGHSRAFLAPENRAKLTCRAEFTGLRDLTSTAPILDRLEQLGREFDGVQHWGMFRNLTSADVKRGYPRLDNWRRVRWQLTGQGARRTFDNDFSVRVGLSDSPTNPSIDYLIPLLLDNEAS
jgi:FAD binding domain